MLFLIVKTSAIGDVIQTFPVLEYLRNLYPTARIDWVVEKACASLLSSHPLLDNVLIIDTKKWRKQFLFNEIKTFYNQLIQTEYDLLFDLQGNTKSAFITKFARAKIKVGFGYNSVPEKPNLLATTVRYEVAKELDVRSRYLKLVQQYFQDERSFTGNQIHLRLSEEEKQHLLPPTESLRLMIGFGAKWKNKRLSDETLEQLLDKIYEAFQPIFLFTFGCFQEEILALKLRRKYRGSQVIGNLPFALWQALIFQMDGVIAMDSCALHLCGTTTTPSFSIFGPSSSQIYKPLGEHHQVFQGKCPYGQNFITRCPKLRTCSTGACIKDLSADELFIQVKEWLCKIIALIELQKQNSRNIY